MNEMTEPIQTKMLSFVGAVGPVVMQKMRNHDEKGRQALLNGLKKAGLLENRAEGLIRRIVARDDRNLSRLLSVCQKFEWGDAAPQKFLHDPPANCTQPVLKRKRAESEDVAIGGAPPPNDNNACAICFELNLDGALNPCGHMLCYHCAVKMHVCPICTAPVKNAIKLYIP